VKPKYRARQCALCTNPAYWAIQHYHRPGEKIQVLARPGVCKECIKRRKWDNLIMCYTYEETKRQIELLTATRPPDGVFDPYTNQAREKYFDTLILFHSRKYRVK
jgi:hypothetical protein